MSTNTVPLRAALRTPRLGFGDRSADARRSPLGVEHRLLVVVQPVKLALVLRLVDVYEKRFNRLELVDSGLLER